VNVQLSLEAHARTTDPLTSHLAAEQVGELRDKQIAVLRVLRKLCDATHEELVDAYCDLADVGAVPRQSPSGIRSRCAELVAGGYVADSGARGVTRMGRQTTIWQPADTVRDVRVRSEML
jgi:hypothetical protein